MIYSIQNNMVQASPTITPTMNICCRACDKTSEIIGTDIPTEGYSLLVIYADIEDSITQSMEKQGWKDLICPACIEMDKDIVRKYNDTEDNYED